MKRAWNPRFTPKEDIYMRIGAKRKSPQGIPYVGVLKKSNEV